MSFDFIHQSIAQRKSQHLLRKRRVIDSGAGRFINVSNEQYINFSSNDYLGLAADSRIAQAASSAMRDFGIGSGGSPLVTGYQKPHQQLEQLLCHWLGFEDCLLFNSGFSANQAVISGLMTDKAALLVQDKLIHASLIEAGTSVKAQFKRFRHNDLLSLTQQLESANESVVDKLVVTEGVFSMDGDKAPLSQISEVCAAKACWLMVDDAHGVGVCGEDGAGTLSEADVKADIHMVTFGKAIGTMGAVVGGSRDFIEYLTQVCRHYIYSTAMPAAMAAATIRSVELIQQEPWRRHKLQQLIGYFKHQMVRIGLKDNQSQSAIQPIIIGDAAKTMAISENLLKQGIWLSAIRPPTVAKNTSRLRVTLTAQHEYSDIDKLFEALEGAL